MAEAGLPARVAWAEGLPLNLPAALLRLLGEPPPTGDAAAAARQAAEALKLAAAFTEIPPASTRLPFSYQTIPGPMRPLRGRLIGRVQRARQAKWARYPGWPLDLSADVAADLAGAPGITFRCTPVLLTGATGDEVRGKAGGELRHGRLECNTLSATIR
jgi:hypothetical protein